MSEPLANSTPEDVIPYAPKWASQPGYRTAQPDIAYDAFSDQENPSYRSMAELFSPKAPQKKRTSQSTKMLLRFGAVIGIAGGALALFVGYIATQPGDLAENATRFKSVNNAVATVQAALAPSAPHTERQPPAVAAVPDAPKSVQTVPIEPIKAPETATAAPVADLASNRAVAPQPAPEPVAAAPVAPAAPPMQMAALPTEPQLPVTPVQTAPQLTAGELTTLMARGRRFIESGDFSSARPVYRRAAEAGYAEAALALGETYDPHALSQRGAIGMGGDVAQARQWYERARDLGSLEAPTRLDRLPRN